MSHPDPFVLDSQNYRYGILSAALEEIFQRRTGSPVNAEEVRQLEMAKGFLSDVVAGAKLISKGETGAVSATIAVDALSYALEPLVAIDRLRSLTVDGVLEYFKKLQDCVAQSISAHQVSGSDESRRSAVELFHFLNESILASLNRRMESEKAAHTELKYS